MKILCLFVAAAAFALRRFSHFVWTWISVRKLNVKKTFSSVAGKGILAERRKGLSPDLEAECGGLQILPVGSQVTLAPWGTIAIDISADPYCLP